MEQKAKNIVFERFKKIVEINSDKIIHEQEERDRLDGINVMNRKYYKNYYLKSVRDIIENIYDLYDERYRSEHFDMLCTVKYKLSQPPVFTFDFIEKNLEQPLEWSLISDSPDLTFDIIEKYPDKDWDWYGILTNFTLFKTEYEKVLKFIKIEKELIEKSWHPKRFVDWCLDESEKDENE